MKWKKNESSFFKNIKKNIERLLLNSISNHFNLYLIGSRATQKNLDNSDFDFLLVILKPQDILSLSKISGLLNDEVNKNSKYKVSIRVFDKSSFNNFYTQDYFRYLEYKLSNKPILKLEDVFNIQLKHSKKILLFQLINSIIIQYWWSIIAIASKQNIEVEIKTKLLNRINRNIELFYIETTKTISFSEIIYLLEKEHLYKSIYMLKSNNYNIFLDKYFDRFQHEKINKAKLYQNTLDTNYNAVKVAIKSINIKNFK